MCHFITASLPADTQMSAVRTVCGRYNLSFEELKNPFVIAQLAGDRYLRATNRFCDCGTPLGGSARLMQDRQKDESHATETARLKKKGWSQAKIDRWLAERSQALERRARNVKEAGTMGIAEWREFICSLLESDSTKRLGLLLHFYKGNPEQEHIQLKRRENLSVLKLSESDLLSMEEDVLYLFSK